MKNNKLTAKYIKDVFRFMEMYHLRNVSVGNVWFEYIKDGGYNEYNISIVFDNSIEKLLDPDESTTDLFSGYEVSEVISKIKNSEYYMMELEV